MISLEFDAYSPRAQCAVALIAALSIVERAVINREDQAGTRTLERWDDFLEIARSRPAFRSAGAVRHLDEFFVKPPKPIAQLNQRNPLTTVRVADLMAVLLNERFFKAGTPLSRAKDGEVDAPDLAELAKKLHNFSSAAHFRDIIDKTDPEKAGPDDCVIRFFRHAFGTALASHPTFPSMRIYDLRGLKAEFHGLYDRSGRRDPNSGLFAVIREARGWASAKPKDVNLLVRDLLWLLPRENEEDQAARGLYLSVVDNDSFVINERLERDAPVAIASGTMDSKDGSRQRCKLIFAEFENDRKLEVRDGVIAGTTNDEPFFAAWKVLVIRPEWQDEALQTVIYQCTASQASDALQFGYDVGAMGVLFSEKMRTKRPEVHGRREAFRSLIGHTVPQLEPSKAFGDFASQELRSRLRDVIEKAQEDLAAKSVSEQMVNFDATANELLEQVIERLQGFVTDKWHLIEPAQIITYKETRHTRRKSDVDAETSVLLSKLLERTGICRYSDA